MDKIIVKKAWGMGKWEERGRGIREKNVKYGRGVKVHCHI